MWGGRGQISGRIRLAGVSQTLETLRRRRAGSVAETLESSVAQRLINNSWEYRFRPLGNKRLGGTSTVVSNFHHIDEKKCRPSITSAVWRQDTPRLLKTCAVAIGETCPSQNIVLPFDGIDAREEYNSCKYANINIRLEKLVFETQAQNLRSSYPSSHQ